MDVVIQTELRWLCFLAHLEVRPRDAKKISELFAEYHSLTTAIMRFLAGADVTADVRLVLECESLQKRMLRVDKLIAAFGVDKPAEFDPDEYLRVFNTFWYCVMAEIPQFGRMIRAALGQPSLLSRAYVVAEIYRELPPDIRESLRDRFRRKEGEMLRDEPKSP
ncbi:hypothetical protein HY358_01610 [Candidatus Roizmanbacteria bacterium]|nr:hypothetical protein [Candidatus Roizmanbacteria bacterium]